MDIYGLVGKSLSHSKSPVYFNKRFEKEGIDAEYRLFEIDNPEDIEKIILETPNLKGLNVTIPYKRSFGYLMDSLSPEVKKTGSLNTIKIIRNSKGIVTKAYNTDIRGFESSIKPIINKYPGVRALILGTGGAAHTASYVFRRLGVFYYFISRRPAKVVHMGYNWITKELLDEYRLIINCTPVGMYPNVDIAPLLPYDYINSNNICFDCIYNPEDTLFLKRSRLNGAETLTGKQMFEVQANQSWKIWLD